MKSKSRAANPLQTYRRLQREIRDIFDPFTTQHCPTCTTPCCVKPTRVTPLDVALALGIGHAFPHLADPDPYTPALDYATHRFSAAQSLPMVNNTPPSTEYCEYLHQGRCTFPDDLRPFGCTQYLCEPMLMHLPPETLAQIQLLLDRLKAAHTALLRKLNA